MLLGQPFVNAGTKVSADFWSASLTSYPLLRLAGVCRAPPQVALDVLDKAILLLRLNADITVVDGGCDNILHCVLSSEHFKQVRGNETQAKAWMVATCDCDRCNSSFREPRELLTVSITAGADIYAFNGDGKTPTMVANFSGHEVEWVEALAECGIDFEQVLLHTSEWENVVNELDTEFSNCSSETRAKIVEEFESSFWNAGNIRQESSLTFQTFCEERDLRRRLRVDCDYEVATANYGDMIKHLRDGEKYNNWNEEESQRASEMPADISENALSLVEELEAHQDQHPVEPTDTFTRDMEEHADDGVVGTLDDWTSLVEHDNVSDTVDIYGSNGDLAMADVYWGDDLFDLGSDYVDRSL
jgi:hypothetical protein